MDGDMEHRADYLQCPDGRVTADLISLSYGITHHRRRFLQYWAHRVSPVVLAYIQLGA